METALHSQPYRESTLYIFGVRVDNTTCRRALERIRHYILHRNGSRAREVFFTNVHSIHLARRDALFHHCLNHADLVLPDGSGLGLAGKFFGTPIIENLNGTDFTPKLLREAGKSGWTVYLLGARPGVAEQCQQYLSRRFPTLKVIGFHHGYFSSEESDVIVKDINSKQPDILLVALGSPFQEKWIVSHVKQLKVKVCLAVGGLFDFLGDFKKRAPLWMRQLGIEWVYRFFQDPKAKWERIFVEIPLFLLKVLVGRLAPRRMRPISTQRRLLS